MAGTLDEIKSLFRQSTLSRSDIFSILVQARILLEKDKQKWIRLYRDALLSVENYEMLHKLKLEQEWNI